MKNIINKLVFNKLVYILGTTVLVAGIIILTAKMFPKIKIAEAKNESKIVSEIKVADSKNLEKITSRSNDEVRNETQEKESTETENKQKDTTKSTSTENNKSTTSKSTTKKTTSTTKKANTTKKTTKNKKKKNATETTKSTKQSGLKISKDMDLTVRTGLTRDEFIKLMAGVKADTSGFFEKNAGTIYDLCEKYSINEIFFCGLISAESGWNIASNHRRTYNYISMMSKGKLIQFGSVEEGLEAGAKLLHTKYLSKGGSFYHGKTLSGVKVCFCPSSTWVNLVYGRMKQIV